MERGVCFGHCPVYSIQVFTDGDIRYEGELYVATAGTLSAKLTPETMTKLRRALADSGFDAIPKDCCQCNHSLDDAMVTLSVVEGGRKKTISDYQGCQATPTALRELENEVDLLVGTEQWIGTEERRRELFESDPSRLPLSSSW